MSQADVLARVRDLAIIHWDNLNDAGRLLLVRAARVLAADVAAEKGG